MSKVINSTPIATYPSSSNPSKSYEVLSVKDDAGHTYMSCNCPAWTTSTNNRGKQAWERICKHTERARFRAPAQAGPKVAATAPKAKIAPKATTVETDKRFEALEL